MATMVLDRWLYYSFVIPQVAVNNICLGAGDEGQESGGGICWQYTLHKKNVKNLGRCKSVYIFNLQRSDPSRVKGFQEKPTIAQVHGTQAENSWCSQMI